MKGKLSLKVSSINIAAVVNKTYVLKILSEGSRAIAPEENCPRP